jgi:AcrR family transcriptional regulator
MNPKERRRRQFAEREQLFLDRAWEMVRQDGLLNLQMARLATECGYAVGTLYQHFTSKEDLLLALAAASMAERHGLFQRVVDWRASGRERMFAFVVADILFAEREPQFFRLSQYVTTQAVWAATSPARREAVLAAAQPIGNLVDRVAQESIDAGEVDPRGASAEELTLGLWSMCVGVHQLVHAIGFMEMKRIAHPYRQLLRQAQTLLNGLDWKPLVVPSDDAALRSLLSRMMRELFPDFSTATALGGG